MKEKMMEFLFSWITNIKSMGLLIGILLFWMVVSSGLDSLYSGCTDTSNAFNFLQENCVKEGIRNSNIVDKVFQILIVLGLIFSLIINASDMLQNKSGRY